MSVYVDSLMQHGLASYHGPGAAQAARVGAKHGHRWCHLFADSPQELLEFAVKKLGMQAAWFQRDNDAGHFDLVPPRRAKAVKLGAVEVTRSQAVEIWRQQRAARLQRAAERYGMAAGLSA